MPAASGLISDFAETDGSSQSAQASRSSTATCRSWYGALSGPGAVVRTGSPELVPEVEPDLLGAFAGDAGSGAVILLIVSLLVNNLSKNRKYPEYWF